MHAYDVARHRIMILMHEQGKQGDKFSRSIRSAETETAPHQSASKMKLSMPKGISLYFPPSPKVHKPQAIQRAWNLHIKLLPYYQTNAI